MNGYLINANIRIIYILHLQGTHFIKINKIKQSFKKKGRKNNDKQHNRYLRIR